MDEEVLLVSLVSDQTIPNVQLINELKAEGYNYLFISTSGMEKKGVRQWIINSTGLPSDKVLPEIIVDQFSFEDTENKLNSFDFDQYEKVVVNLTGGTKVMTLAAYNFFQQIGAEIFYLTGSDDELIRLAPKRKKRVSILTSKINVIQYLTAYGFTVGETEPSGIDSDYTNTYFNLFANGQLIQYNSVIDKLRNFRKKNCKLDRIEGLSEFISKINFPHKENGKLLPIEVKYLTGEWFEEYVSQKLKMELNLTDDEIKTGLVISKKNRKGELIPNEMDVIFIWKNKIHTIECKTSVFYQVEVDGKLKNKNILSETLYKSDSLRQGFGLYVNTSIFILDLIEESNHLLKEPLERADLYNIKIVDKKQLLDSSSIKSILRITF